MYEKINYKLVGVFVTIFTFVAIYFGFWLAKSGMGKNSYNFYYSYFSESVDGLNKDSIVKLNGVDVGRVVGIYVDNRYLPKVKVKIAIAKNIKITDEMSAILKSQGITGLRYINIETITKKGNIIIPNREKSIIKTKESMLASISQSGSQTLANLAKLSLKIDKVLSNKNVQNFSKILENTDKLTSNAIILEKSLNRLLGGNDSNKSSIKNFVAVIKDLNKSISQTLTEYNKLAKNGNITLKTLNTKLPTLLRNVNSAAKRLSATSKLLNRTIKRGDYNLKRILRPAVVNVQELSIKYKELANELESLTNNPVGSIFNPKNPPKGPGE